MDILSGLLGTVAPMLATALGGPLAGGAVKFIAGQLLGDENASLGSVVEAVKNAPPEQLRDLDAQYKAETARLVAEQGTLSETFISKLSGKTADKVAWLRMATRPRVVLRMSHYLMVPLYLMAVDGLLAFINLWLVFFDSKKQVGYLAAKFFASDSVYSTMYAAGVAPAATIVVSYMTLRQIEKSGNPLKSIIGMFKSK